MYSPEGTSLIGAPRSLYQPMRSSRVSQLDYDWEGDVPSTCPMVHRQSTYPRIILSTFIQVAIHAHTGRVSV